MASMTSQWRLLAVLLYIVHLHTALTCPDVCTCTFGNAVVNCNGKALETVPQNIPTTENNISDISSGAFENLVNLRELYLDNNALTNIQYGTFTGLVDLQTLSLSFNAINSVSNDSFTGLTNLRTLYLQNNDITTIPTGPFKRSPNIVTLYLHNNPLRCDCVLYELVQWFNKDGRYLGDIYEELTCASSPFPELVGLSVTDAASQMTTCVQTTSLKPGTSSTPSPPTQAITQPSSKTMTAKSTTSSKHNQGDYQQKQNESTHILIVARQTSTQSYLTTKNLATTKRNTTAGRVTTKGTTEQDSTLQNSTISQVTSTLQEATTKTTPFVTSRAGTSTQNTTTAQKTNLNTTDTSLVLPPKERTIPVTEHLIGIQDVTVGETVTIRCDAASPSKNVTYRWSVDGKQDPDYRGQILRYIPQRNGSHRIQCTAHTDEGDGVSDIITLFVKPADILIEDAGEDSAVPGNGSTPDGPPVIRVTEHIIGIQDITVGETVTVRCDTEGLPTVCVKYRWTVDGEVVDGQNGQTLR
ncbi:hypothetical protein Bbelb_359880 [Branchiostoma belcheri]|nr:hypothetical protein Bbelb_359880 [Branchiostoma belcheri]